MLDAIRWIAEADFHNTTPEFGAVSGRYKDGFLVGKALDGAVRRYFDECIPSSVYEGNSAECWFRFFDSDELWAATHDYNFSEVFKECGFLTLATDQGGNPLLLDPPTGRLYVFQFGYLYEGGVLSRLGKDGKFVDVPATRENVISFCKYSWQDLDEFYSEVLEKTRKWHRNGLLYRIKKADVPHLRHYQNLGLGLDVTDEEGRGPLEIARITGNQEVIALVESMLKENH